MAAWMIKVGLDRGARDTAFDHVVGIIVARRGGMSRHHEPVHEGFIIGVERPEGFTLSATRLYVMRTSSLEIYDAKTGALVGEI